MTIWNKNYLGDTSQPWARQVEKEIDNQKALFQSAEVNNVKRDDQLASSLRQVQSATASATQAATDAADAAAEAAQAALDASAANSAAIAAQADATQAALDASTANTNALNALQDIVDLASPGGPTLHASNLTAGTITAVDIGAVNISGASISGGSISSTGANGTVTVSNGSVAFSGGGKTGSINPTSTYGLGLTSSDRVYVSAPNGIEGAYASFAEASAGTKLTVDSIKRQTNGQLTFTTSAGTTCAYFDTTSSASSYTHLYTVGNISAQSYTTRSSQRFKTNIEPYALGAASVLDLNVVNYQYNPSALGLVDDDGNEYPLGKVEVGLIAEQVAETNFRNLVNFSDEEETVAEGIDYSRIGVLLIPEVKALREQVAELTARLEALEG